MASFSAATAQLKRRLGAAVRTDRRARWAASFDSSKLSYPARGGRQAAPGGRRRRGARAGQPASRAGHGARPGHDADRLGGAAARRLGDRPHRSAPNPHRRRGGHGPRAGGRNQRRDSRRRRGERLVLPARSLVKRVLHHRRQHRLQRRRHARRQIRRHPRLCARAEGLSADRRVGGVGDGHPKNSPRASICATSGSAAKGCSAS